MNILNVYLWGQELGRLSWNSSVRQCYFTFNPELKENRPDVSPLLLPLRNWHRHQMTYGDDRKIYQSLPPFIADSLPDSWGNKLFEQWAKGNKLSIHNISPLYKLMFIGKRGMGALEFEPAAVDLDHNQKIDVKALHDLSLKILNDREEISILPDEEVTMQALLAVGTSAGGRQMKAIIAINRETGEIRSGQIDRMEGYDYCLLKFEDDVVPTSEIEMAFHDMAIPLGINMMECRLLNVGGVNHFLTHRFDRKDGMKIHMQTLAAINPDATSYEELFATCREMQLSDSEIEQLYRRLVFNVLANNTDDHNKNFSFLLEKDGRWRLSPAYDLTFIFNRFGTGPETDRCLSIAGKYRGITKEDLIEIGKENGIRNPKGIIERTADVLKTFPELADKYGIDPRWGNIINATFHDNILKFGYAETVATDTVIKDTHGRTFTNVTTGINIKGHYELNVSIDGIRHRRFIRPKMELYPLFQAIPFQELNTEKKIEILEQLFPTDNRNLTGSGYQ